MDLLKAKATEGLEKRGLFPGTTNTAAPKVWILLQMLRHQLIANNVADSNTTTRSKNAANVGQQPISIRWIHQIENAIT
jgi:hypothetical protein|tara:strand:+ start:376 stop:612 length:237 start_codon:yes stop_codon:yes gene_type:complete